MIRASVASPLRSPPAGDFIIMAESREASVIGSQQEESILFQENLVSSGSVVGMVYSGSLGLIHDGSVLAVERLEL